MKSDFIVIIITWVVYQMVIDKRKKNAFLENLRKD